MPPIGNQEITPHTADEWAEMLRAKDMPIFSNTASSICASLDDRNQGALELAAIILQDPNLTAKLLRVGNSPFYNPSRQKMSTISRAIVVLGAEVIRELTMACSFFEAILSSTNKERANREIAQALHAAVQARDLAVTLKDVSPEEVFIAALLHNIGHIAFWCSGKSQVQKIHNLIDKSGINSGEAEKQILGFGLPELSKKLCKAWHLGGLIEEAILYPDSSDTRIQTVRMGHQICEALKDGHDSEAMTTCLQKIAQLTGSSPEMLRTKIKKNTVEAVHVARQFGANDASRFIDSEIALGRQEVTIDDTKVDKKQLQIQILQDIGNLVSGKIDLSVLFEMVLEGIHRGVEMDRTLFLLLSTNKHVLTEKFSLGWPQTPNHKKIQIQNSDKPTNLLFHAIDQQEGVWQFPEQHAELYSPQITQYLGQYPCFIFPIQSENKTIGLIYCDRSINGIPLSRDDFTAAKHFAKQAHIGLTLYRIQNH